MFIIVYVIIVIIESIAIVVDSDQEYFYNWKLLMYSIFNADNLWLLFKNTMTHTGVSATWHY